jgi:hypothetical protein
MRPAQRIKQAEDVARKFKALVNSSTVSQLLQHTPPAAVTAEQEAQLVRCCNVTSQVEAALYEAPTLRIQLVDAILKQQVACNIGRLVTRVQQQPEQQLVEMRAVAVAGREVAAGRSTASIWAVGVHLLNRFAAVAFLQNTQSAGACSLASTLTQQLDQSGKACSHNCMCTV